MSAPDKEAGDYCVLPKQVSPNLYSNDESLDFFGIASAFFALSGRNLCVA